MRALLAAVLNLVVLLFKVLGLPMRALRTSRRPRYVQFRLKGDPPYRRPRGMASLFAKRDRNAVRSVEDLATQLALLSSDERVRGVVFLFDEFAAPPAKRDALHDLFEGLRKSGKEILAYSLSASNTEYELMCAADRIALAPGGRIDLVGFSAEATALGTALGRIGVRAEFIRRGDYKTAPELFTHEEVSDIQRQTIEGFLDEQYSRLISAVARGRKLDESQARSCVDAGPYSSARALRAGLCDAICSEADLPLLLTLPPDTKEIPERTHAEERKAASNERATLGSFESYNAKRVWPLVRWRRWRRRPRVGVVAVSGMIVSGDGGKVPFGPRTTGADGIVRALRAAGRDSRAKAVVLYVASPGGSSLASEQILEAVQRVARRKPVVAFFDRVAASGGYLAAMGAKEIWSDRSAVTGSIGVFAGKFDLSGLLARLGIYRTVFTRGENAGLSSSARALTQAERASLEAEVEETYQAFLQHVARARSMTTDDVHRLAEGRVYSGEHARRIGLVDRVGGFEDACRRALELAGKTPAAFDLASYQRGASPATIGSLLRSASSAQVYALWMPLLTWPGHDGAEEFEL